MVIEILEILVLLGAGITAGVLFGVALSVVPALSTMPPSRYVYTHQLLGRNWDPTMPVIVLSSAVAGMLAAVTGTGPARPLFAATALLLVGVSGISHLGNVPLNRAVKQLSPDSIPAHWLDPRPRWRMLHLVRTTLAVLALLTAGIAAVVG